MDWVGHNESQPGSVVWENNDNHHEKRGEKLFTLTGVSMIIGQQNISLVMFNTTISVILTL